MNTPQHTLIQLALDVKALSFGQFTLKSGRVSPYFFNSGAFNSGQALKTLGECYAQTVLNSQLEFDMLFGPAYKGIPLVSATAIALSAQGHDFPYSFNRKEAKDHGEGGSIIGSPLQGKILVVDDVISAGTAINESAAIIQDNEAQFAGVLIAMNRQERGQGSQSAVQEVEQRYGVPVLAAFTLDDLIAYSSEQAELIEHLDALQAYRREYGV
jgi:orotate phosphoribosyltransferase